MFNFLKSIVTYKVKDIEAKLFPAPGCTYGGKGEVEFEVNSNGVAELEVELKHTGIPNGCIVDVVANGMTLASVSPMNGFIKQHFEFNEIDQQSTLESGDIIEMKIDGQTLYSGSFQRD